MGEDAFGKTISEAIFFLGGFAIVGLLVVGGIYLAGQWLWSSVVRYLSR